MGLTIQKALNISQAGPEAYSSEYVFIAFEAGTALMIVSTSERLPIEFASHARTTARPAIAAAAMVHRLFQSRRSKIRYKTHRPHNPYWRGAASLIAIPALPTAAKRAYQMARRGARVI